MARGDQIYVMRPLMNMDGVYEHHGIDCGDGTVVHYYKGGEVPTVARTSFDTFARGNPVFVKSRPIAYVPEVVLERATSRLGEQQYNLLTNNCEHFATWCKTGKNESQQLIDYGVGIGTINPLDSQQMLETAAQESNPVETVELLDQALSNNATARGRLQVQAKRVQTEMDTWSRVAQLALKRNREDLARAALERKVKHKRQWDQIQEQLQQLDRIQETLIKNSKMLQQQVVIDPSYSGTR